jgi:hypothetical protein
MSLMLRTGTAMVIMAVGLGKLLKATRGGPHARRGAHWGAFFTGAALVFLAVQAFQLVIVV